MIFTGNEWVGTVNSVNDEKGTFTYTATHITMATTHKWDGKKWTSKSDSEAPTPDAYSISGNTLTITSTTNTGETMAVALVKQP